MDNRLPSWRTNLRRNDGFWRDGRWYDVHLERDLPHALPMLDEMVLALPPLPPGTSVCDLACGTGNAGYMVAEAYPGVHVTLVDEDADLLGVAEGKVGTLIQRVEPLLVSISDEDDAIPGGPYDVVVASLALHALIGEDVGRAEAETRYELLFRAVHAGLAPGGHLIVGDHVGTLGLFSQLKAMERAGFADVDCSWRQDDFFVAGGRVAD